MSASMITSDDMRAGIARNVLREGRSGLNLYGLRTDHPSSDILRRHEATHAASMQASSARTVSTRACTECARSRERCTKSSPCQRCLTKGLRCAYPHARLGTRSEALQYDTAPDSQILQGHVQDTDSSISDVSRLSRQPQVLDGPERSVGTPYQQIISFEMADYSNSQMLQPTMDFPMNWLPPDPSLAIDYDNIVGLGVGSLDFFTLPNLQDDGSSTQSNTHHEPMVTQPTMGQFQPNGTERRNSHLPLAGVSETWNILSPETAESHVSSTSPYSTTHNVSPSEAPGGLYATSVNGARMPCTIRARKANRLLPGARPLQRLHELQTDNLHEQAQTLSFPDTNHILIEGAMDADSGSDYTAPLLARSTYEGMLQGFSKLCLDDQSSFLPYSSSRFPGMASLNMCIRLYFDNFDAIMPIFHDQVTQISDHWILALAVSAVGCQYAEANEYAQMVEPLHELVRRAITVASNTETIGPIGEHQKYHLAFSQARLLNQVGMLYSGSSRLLGFAKAQHSGMVELARDLMSPATATPLHGRDGDERDPLDLTWITLLHNECKRRIAYSIWLLDCMAVYHFGQQLLMPPSMMSAPLPNDKLWSSRIAGDWDAVPASSRDTLSLSSATVMLFREKKVMAELGQYSRVLLLHGVYREIFQLKDCFARPLGNWVPSIQQQASAEDEESSASPAVSDRGGRSLLNSWRNAGLDCVDVLHWAANGTIALQAGAEHPFVLHLHLSRTILLAPFDQLQTLARSVVMFAQKSTSAPLDAAHRQTAVDAERDILEWAQRDQCKARLAVLHSGCLFWHIRRYSCRAFYEPMAIFLATLTIWAYSSYASRAAEISRESSDQIGNEMETSTAIETSRRDNDDTDAAHCPSDEDTEEAPTFIHLDRPNDDEMVQAFVRFGTASAMRANIAGVGDIYAAKGPTKILKEGRKILTAVSTAWGRTDRFSSVLEVLEQVASGRVT